MTTSAQIPDSADAFREASLEDITAHYRALAERPLDDIEAWLADWSQLEDAFNEAATEASVAYDCDTADEEKERRELRFSSELSPRLETWRVKLGQRLVDSGFTRPDLETTVRRWRNRIELFRDQNVPLVAEEQKLSSRYSKVIGAMTVDWEGETLTVSQMRPYCGSGDRAVRERAWRAFFSPFIAGRDELADIFDRLWELRQEIARNAGFESYRDYAHRAKNRFDYSPDDTRRFHEAVEQTVVPAVERIYARRARLMGLDGTEVRPWDALDNHVATPDPLGRPALRPFATEEELLEKAAAVFHQVDPALGGYFDTMRERGMLDLMSRPGKAPGGYCTSFPLQRLPFVFMNSAGVSNDVDTLLHEAGHAFHVFEAQRLPYSFQRFAGSEMAEVASMSMELLGAPYLALAEDGFYSKEDAARARTGHLEEILTSVAHIASVDAFQHWIYTSPDGRDRDARDAKWLEIRARFQRGIDWSGCEKEQVARWYEQIHFFGYPFYYIEYGLAQMGALQVWRNALTDQAGAVRAYRQALALGGSRPLPELYAAAGAKLVFDAPTMGELVGLVEEELSSLNSAE